MVVNLQDKCHYNLPILAYNWSKKIADIENILTIFAKLVIPKGYSFIFIIMFDIGLTLLKFSFKNQ